MRLKVIFHVLGMLLCCTGLTMLMPLGFALYYNDASTAPLAWSIVLTLAVGGAAALAFRSPKSAFVLNHREGIAIVAFGWLVCGLSGALPYFFSGCLPGFVDAFFESVSGFTTTGASILTDIEALPKGLLMWRALTHWLGGMGIILFSIAVLPYLGVGGMSMYKAELASPTADKLHPRLHDTAMTLWLVYGLLTALLCILLLLGGMDFFDSLAHTFATLATGGFSTKNASVGHYNSPYIQWTITLFMFVAGVNFSLHYKALRGSPASYGKSVEFKWYLAICLISTLAIAASVYGKDYGGLEESLRHSAFQALSIITTTGYATADYLLWAPTAQAVILLLFFVGGCAGSTAGGIKVTRIVLLFKTAYHELFRLVHPRTVHTVKMDGAAAQRDVITGVLAFFILYMLVLALCGLLLCFCGVSVAEAFSGVLSCLGNVGPAFGSLGPAGNYAALPAAAKLVLSAAMLLGRLEIYTIFILLIPEFWRK